MEEKNSINNSQPINQTDFPSSQPNQNNDSSLNSLSSEARAEIAKLQREKAQAEAKVKELQDKLINNVNLSQNKIKDYENQLAETLKEVRNKTRQIQQIQFGGESENQGAIQNSTSSFDWKWAVGLSLGAVIVLLLVILIVVNISRQKKE